MNAMHPAPVDLPQAMRLALRDGGDTHTLGDVAQAIVAGEAQYWQTPEGDGCAVTELLDYPRRRVVRIWLAGGRLRALRRLAPDVEAWARDAGAHELVTIGRSGWLRDARCAGWHAAGVFYRKELAR